MHRPPEEPIHVLHVDDEPGFADLAATYLERSDEQFDVTTATSADEGLKRIADVDCVVSDYEMPGRNGIEFLRTVREHHSDLPFILFTGKGSEEVASDAISAGVTDYLQKGSGTDQYELLAHRVRNAVEQHRATRRAVNLERIRTLASDINQALIRATSRTEVETRICEIISESEPYRFAWVGTVDSETDRIEPRTSAGVDGGYLDAITITADDTSTGQGPGGRAIRERRVVVSQDVRDDPAFEPWREEAIERGFRSVAAVPLEYGDTLYGVLGVYADRDHAFDENERALLAELGDDIAHVFHSFEIREQLRTERDRRTALFENAPVPVTTGEIHPESDQHLISDVNETFEEVFGHDAADVVGRDVADVVVPAEERSQHEEFREQTAAGNPVEAEVTRTTVDGPREFLLYSIPYGVDDGEADGWYAWYTDITDRKERERELEMYETIVEAIEDAVYVVDEDGRIEYVNSTYAEMKGVERGELLDMPIEEWADDEVIERIRSMVEELERGERDIGTVDYEFRTADGDRIPAELRFTTLALPDGQRGRVGVIRDVTDRKERERRLETLIDNLPGMVYRCQNERGWSMDHVRGSVEELTGYPADEIEDRDGIYGQEILHPEDREEVWTAVQDALEAEESFELTYRITTDAGETRWVWERGQGIYSTDGELEALEGFVTDITDRKELEQELREKSNLLDQLFEQIPIHLFVKDREGRYVYLSEYLVNEADAVPDADEQIGRTVLDVYPEEFAREAHDDEMAVVETVEPIVDKEEYEPSEGEWNLSTKVPWRGPDGDVKGLIGVTQQITERKEYEQELERQNERLDEFASVVAHDLRNPLSVAKGRLKLAQEECDSPHLEDAADAVGRSLALLDDLLTLAREGEQVSAVEAVDLADTLADCWRTTATADATLVVATEQTIQADPSRLKELLENVFRNAVEHGGEDVTVTAGDLADGFYVADDGPGLPAEEPEHVFEIGYSTTDDGLGFGLNIVKEIAEAHDWEIHVTDSETGGARFEITGVVPADE